MTTVKLHGWLGKKYGKTFKMNVTSARQAIGLLRCNFKDFAKDVCNFSGGFRVSIGEDVISQDELCRLTNGKTIHIVPAITGSGRGLGQVIVGAVMIYMAYNYGMTEGIAATGTSAAVPAAFTTFGSIAFNVGSSLVLGGIMQMITPVPKNNVQFHAERADNRPSYLFNGSVNTVSQGNPISILYGELLVGSQVISAGLSTRQLI